MTYPVGTQLRVITPKNLSFGVGRVTSTSPGTVTLENRNEETVTVSTDVVKHLPVLLADRVRDAVTGICAQVGMANAMGQLPFVRTFADLHDHMDANVLLLNHVPDVFGRDANGDVSEDQVGIENLVSDMVNKWLIERWDNDPINQPAPTEAVQVASILAAMLNMATEEQQWGNASVVEILPEIEPNTVRLLVDNHEFNVTVTRTTTPLTTIEKD
jgi:hypothetical protein